MPDFSQLEYSDWLDTITLCITVAVLMLGLIYSQILHSPTTRQRFIALLQASKVRNLYQAGVSWFLAFLQRFYGPKDSVRAFSTSLVLAQIYPIFFFIFSYSYLDGENRFSNSTTLPANYQYKEFIFPSLIIFVLLIAIIYRYKDLINNKIKIYLDSLKISYDAWRFITGTILAVIFWTVDSNKVIILIGFLYGYFSGLVPFAILVPIVYFCFFVLAKDAFLSSDGSLVFISVFSFAAAFSLKNKFGSRISALLIVLAAVVFSGLSNKLKDYNLSLLLAFFYICLPLLNALFDWISWWVSRFFMERTAVDNVAVSVIFIDVLIDFCVAVLLILALVLFLPGLSILVDFLYQNKEDILSNLPAETNWQDYAVWARDDPWGKGIMVTLMLFTTLIPTLLHIFLGLVAFYIHAFKGQALATFLSQANPEDNIANMQATAWVFGYVVLAALSMLLLWLGLNHFLNLPIAQWLYDFAKLFYPLP